MHSRACAIARLYAARSNRRYHCVPPGVYGLHRWENQHMLSIVTKLRTLTAWNISCTVAGTYQPRADQWDISAKSWSMGHISQELINGAVDEWSKWLSLVVSFHDGHTSILWTMRYDTMISTCAQKLTYSQLNLLHGTKQKRIMKKLKIKTQMLRRNGPVIKSWSQSWGRKGVYSGKDLWKR